MINDWKVYYAQLDLMISLAGMIKEKNRKSGAVELKELSYLLLKTHSSFKQLVYILKKADVKGIPWSEYRETLSAKVLSFYAKTERFYIGYDLNNPSNISQYTKLLKDFNSLVNKMSFNLNKKVYEHKTNNFSSLSSDYENEENIKVTYAQAKGLVDDIFKDTESIKITLDKLHLQQTKINELEDFYRHAISKFSLNEDEYEIKRSEIDKGFMISTELIKTHKDIGAQLKQLKDDSAESIKLVKRLNEFATSHNKKYEKNSTELESLILQTKEIMGDASAAKIGEHFKIQYDESKKLLALWPVISGSFLLCAIGICLLTVFPELYVMLFGGDVTNHVSDDAVPFLISRILVAPLFLAGAWFCATQYIKQKNITEDYAYKKVLSLSLLSIKAEVEKTGEKNTSEFIRAIQGEIVKSPLETLDKKHYKNEIELLRTVQSEAVKNIMAQSLSKNKAKKKVDKDHL
ncbi:hypothetical protein ACCX84_04570 [Pantoea trifolii]|uniref:hypothetical protein n=1 Tax=Pantoea trifolii TaxID=2968030 RepID=UPI003ED887AE